MVRLSRNFGHQPALSAALDHTSGDVVVVMDGDLQDPPESIPRLVEEHLKGFDVVYVRRVRRKEGWLLRLCYFGFYRIMAAAASVRLPVDAGDFALMSRRVVMRLREAREHHRYLRGLRSWVGFRQTGLAIERASRHSGRSKYSSLKLIGLALDGLIAFSVAPLRMAAALGLLAIVGSFLFAVYSVYVRLVLGQSPQGFTALILVMTFMSGVQLLFLGVIGEYLGRVYEEVKGRPQYIVDVVIQSVPELPPSFQPPRAIRSFLPDDAKGDGSGLFEDLSPSTRTTLVVAGAGGSRHGGGGAARAGGWLVGDPRHRLW